MQSKELYSEDIHFVMELVQNTDDCTFHAQTPWLGFEIKSDRILVKNNEVRVDHQA